MQKTINQKMYLICGLILLIAAVSSGQVCSDEQKLNGIERIDQDIKSYQRMGFMNENIFWSGVLLMDKKEDELFEHVKLRKFTSVKIDVSEEFSELRNALENNKDAVKQISINTLRQSILNNLSTISTFSIASKRLQGMNFYNHVLIKLNKQFYSLQGDKLYSLPDSSSQITGNSQNLPPTLISQIRNQNFFTAQYISSETNRQDRKCLSLKISQVQMKSRQLRHSSQAEFSNLVVENVVCMEGGGYDHSQVYKQFFTFSSYQNKRVYYILANDQDIEFYLYSQKAQQLVMDQNKSIHLGQLINGQAHESLRITKMVRMNTHLIVTTNKNDLISINLIAYFHVKKKEYLNIYETVPIWNQPIVDVKFNDNDFRFFFVVTKHNVYQYHVSQHKIGKKFGLSEGYCQEGQFQGIDQGRAQGRVKCVENVYVLEKYLLVQYRESQFRGDSQIQAVNFSFSLTDKQSNTIHQYRVPFSHQRKCSPINNKLLLSKNKNAHYVLTLACFIKQNQDNNLANNYLILQHLNLQTSDQLLPQSQLGGIDFSKFRLPMIVFSIGLICYITIKRNSRKSPEKQIEQQKINQKFEEEIMQTIKREKDRQDNLKAVRAGKGNNKME